MLQAIRDRVTGIIAWVIVGLISVTFALWGVNYYLQDNTEVYAAKVNGQEIGVDQYRFALQQQLNRMQATMGERFDRSIINSADFRRLVMERLVEEELLVQRARDAGMTISDALLASRIHSDSSFQVDGEFSSERYKNLLRNEGLSPAYYEHQLRRSLLIDQLLRGVSSSSVVSGSDVEQALRLQNQQREIAFLRIPLAAHLDEVSVSDDAVRQFYEENTSRFVEPQKVKLRYLELTLDDVRDEIDVDEARLRELYASGTGVSGTEEQRRARHILIEITDPEDPQAVAAAREEAAAIRERLLEGADFADLAEQKSDDPGSAAEGGDLGYFSKGSMVAAFEEAAFALNEGEISEPVQSPFGFHIIQVTDIKGAEKPPFEEVRDELYKQATQAEAEQLFYERADRLSELTFEIPDSLQPAADELGLEVQTSDWITENGGPGIGQYESVRASAFSEDVLNDNNNSRLLEVDGEHVVVIRVADHQPAETLPFEAVEETIRDRLRREKAREAAEAEGERLLAGLDAGQTLETLAEQTGYALTAPGFIGRSAPDLNPQIVRRAFSLPRPEDGEPAQTGVSLNNGDYLLLQVSAVKDNLPAGIAEEDRLAFRRNLTRMYGTLEAQAMVARLKAEAEIEINEDHIEK